MSLVLLGVLIALALVVLGRNVPQFQKFPQIRWVLAVIVLAVTVAVSTAKIVPPGNVGVLVLLGKVYGTIGEGVHLVNPLASIQGTDERPHQGGFLTRPSPFQGRVERGVGNLLSLSPHARQGRQGLSRDRP
jgi:hypothetical protein